MSFDVGHKNIFDFQEIKQNILKLQAGHLSFANAISRALDSDETRQPAKLDWFVMLIMLMPDMMSFVMLPSRGYIGVSRKSSKLFQKCLRIVRNNFGLNLNHDEFKTVYSMLPKINQSSVHTNITDANNATVLALFGYSLNGVQWQHISGLLHFVYGNYASDTFIVDRILTRSRHAYMPNMRWVNSMKAVGQVCHSSNHAHPNNTNYVFCNGMCSTPQTHIKNAKDIGLPQCLTPLIMSLIGPAHHVELGLQIYFRSMVLLEIDEVMHPH